MLEATPQELQQLGVVTATDQADVRNQFHDRAVRAALGPSEPSWVGVPGGKLGTNESAIGWAHDLAVSNCTHPSLCPWQVRPLALLLAWPVLGSRICRAHGFP